MANKYNPYNDYEKILGYKADWHTAKNSGQDPSQYYQAAMPYYQSLIANGYSDLATELANSDHAQAGTLRDKYGLKADNQFNLDNDFAAMTGQAATTNTSNNPQTSQDIINAAHPNDASINKLMDMGTGVSGMANDVFNTANGIATGSIPVQPSAATQDLYDLYKDDYNRLNGQIKYDANGNVISGLNTEHYNIGRNQLDYLNNFDITKQPYYQGIMDQYKLGGYNAAQGEYANGAANNSGNIDSYAAANANRQQLAFTTAGMQQAMAMANQNQQNWQNLYSQMSNDLYNQGNLSLETLKVAKDMYAKDADERMNALDQAGSLASKQMEEAISAFEKLVQERADATGKTFEMALKDKDIQNEQTKLSMEIARDLTMNENDNARMIHESDNTLAGTLDTNAKQLESDKYKADADVTSTGIKANADITSAGIRAEADKYASLLDYNSDMAGYQNMLDRIAAQSTADMTQAEYEALKKREYEQWVMDQAAANGWIPSGYTENSYMKSLYDNSGSGGTIAENDVVKADPKRLAKTFVDAVLNNNLDTLAAGGLNNIQDSDDLTSRLISADGYDFSTDDLKVFYEAMKDAGYGNLDDLLVKLDKKIPGIRDAANKALGKKSATIN